MVIAWYPGAGGNRFYKWLAGQHQFELNKGYDRTNPHQYFENRYPCRDTKSQLMNLPVIFTHCVNYDLIKECWPEHDEIYFIAADRHKSLRRQWLLFQQYISPNKHPAGGPFSTVVWHHEYYTKYPWNPGPGTVVDHNSFPEFSTMLEHELDSITCFEFDFAQQVFEQYGSQAPILTLYDQHHDNKQQSK
jgi:hypothetical protein